jgi:hypothetical protein
VDSADEIRVVVQIYSETIAQHVESLGTEGDVGVWTLLSPASVLNESQALELLDCSCGTILLSPVEWVVSLRHLQTEDGVAEQQANNNNDAQSSHWARSLLLEMHSCHWVWQFVVKVFIDKPCGVSKVVMEIVLIHHVVMQVHSAVKSLREEVESDIVPVSRPDLMHGRRLVLEGSGQRKGELPGFEQSHLLFEVLVLSCIVVLVAIMDSNSRCLEDGIGVSH